jgi:hypothetical protein
LQPDTETVVFVVVSAIKAPITKTSGAARRIPGHRRFGQPHCTVRNLRIYQQGWQDRVIRDLLYSAGLFLARIDHSAARAAVSVDILTRRSAVLAEPFAAARALFG